MWSFANSVSTDRAKALLSLVSFETVLELLGSARVDAFAWSKYRGEKLQGCCRVEFLLVVEPQAYDAFFNAPVGLRAQYAISEEHGETATRRILSILDAKLMAYPRLDARPTEAQVRWSLAAPQAKIWIDEREVEAQLGESNHQLLFQRWAENSENGVGLLAPCGTRLIVCGGWLDSKCVVRNSPDKADRSTDIHTTGYS